MISVINLPDSSAEVCWSSLSFPDIARGAYDEKLKPEKMKFSLLLTFSVLAILLLGRGFFFQEGKNNVPIQESGKDAEITDNLKWFRNKEEAYSVAKSQNKKVFIDFYADWCTNCKEFAKLAISNPELNASLSQAVLLKIYDTDPDFKNYANDKGLSELQIGLPFFLITDSNATVLYKTTDYLQTKEMIKVLTVP